jgi:predicted Rossmann fold flavoprotein
MSGHHVVVGGGAAGFFAAIACARADPAGAVTLLERSSQVLAKVRISGGGRCNVTHACFDPRAFSERYPRGGRALIGPLHRFDAESTVRWFRDHGVELKTEPDGRMFPVTDSSRTIVDCLIGEAERLGIKLRTRCGVSSVKREASGGFHLETPGGPIACDNLLLATGGCRAGAASELAASLGHFIEPPVPSLFTFHIETPWLRAIPGVTVKDAELSVPLAGLRERGPVLITHWGLSGPAVLRLSAWGARKLHALDYHFPLLIRWLPDSAEAAVVQELQAHRRSQPGRLVVNSPIGGLPTRLWEQLVLAAGATRETRSTTLTSPAQRALAELLVRTELPVTGKSMNKEEFVTCGGVRLREIDFKTMESRLCPGLYFAGELLDIDGITGGFNFQAAWTTGWIAGHALAGIEPPAIE